MSCKKEINHRCTDEIVCPFCGYEFTDSWEWGKDEEDIGLIECCDCEKSFYAHRNIEVSYATEKANYGTCDHCKADNVVIENYHSSVGSYKNLCVQCGTEEKARLYKEYVNNIHK